MRARGPLADSYAAAGALVIFALVPYLGLTSAVTPLSAIIGRQVGLSPQALQLTDGMANAGYAVGTVMAVQFAVHLRPRRMLVLYASLFVIGSVLAALAPTPGLFIAGRVLQGTCTSLMLIAAVPPLVVGWSVEKMRITAILAGLGCSAAFFGASELETHPMMSVFTLLPLLCGTGAIVLLVAHQCVVKRPLMPVRQLGTTVPVAAIVVAMTAGAASVAVIELAQTALRTQGSPIHIAMLFWPEFGGAVATAILFGAVFRTRLIPLLAFSGMLLVAGGAAVLNGVATAPHVVVIVGSGLVGLGVGASVAPALFMAGFSIASTQIQRVFALIELLRGVAAFLVAPVLLHLAMTVAKTPAAGTPVAMWVCFGLALGGAAVSGYVFLLGRARLPRPDLEKWERGDGPAWESPPLAARIRHEVTLPTGPSFTPGPPSDGDHRSRRAPRSAPTPDRR